LCSAFDVWVGDVNVTSWYSSAAENTVNSSLPAVILTKKSNGLQCSFPSGLSIVCHLFVNNGEVDKAWSGYEAVYLIDKI